MLHPPKDGGALSIHQQVGFSSHHQAEDTVVWFI
jgi:hypothetical protein